MSDEDVLSSPNRRLSLPIYFSPSSISAKESAYELLFHGAVGFAPCGDCWRKTCGGSQPPTCSAPGRIAAFERFRARTGLQRMGEIKSLMEERGEVQARKVLPLCSLNNVMMGMLGRSYDFGARNGRHGSDGLGLEGLVSEGYEPLGLFNWGAITSLRWVGWICFASYFYEENREMIFRGADTVSENDTAIRSISCTSGPLSREP
ncbi:hypothetical protein NL676_030343 [Syzygium grande]|nr:hypothetical protein NL676_030343 [Syzygium grande]